MNYTLTNSLAEAPLLSWPCQRKLRPSVVQLNKFGIFKYIPSWSLNKFSTDIIKAKFGLKNAQKLLMQYELESNLSLLSLINQENTTLENVII